MWMVDGFSQWKLERFHKFYLVVQHRTSVSPVKDYFWVLQSYGQLKKKKLKWKQIINKMNKSAIKSAAGMQDVLIHSSQTNLLEKGMSEVTVILLLLLSMDTTPPPKFPALPLTLMRSCRNCSYMERKKITNLSPACLLRSTFKCTPITCISFGLLH